MKVTLAKPHALNGELLAAGIYELPEASAKKLIAKGRATEAPADAPVGPAPVEPEKKRRPRTEAAAE